MRTVVVSLSMMICFLSFPLVAEDGVPAADKLFLRLDTDGDGLLTRDEIPADARPLFERLVRKADDNDDGKLSRTEFQDAHKEDASPNLPLNVNSERPNRAGGDVRRRFEMLDRNKDGKITRDEVPEQARPRLLPLFERLGKDELTPKDFARIGGDDGNQPDPNRPKGPVFMQLLDTDKDGRISKSEWAKAGEIFGQLDENGDGELDPRELMGPPSEEMDGERPQMERRENRNRPGDGAPRPGGEVFARFDTNKDGKLSKEEAPPRLRDRFDRFDANQDGSLTLEEWRKGFPRPEGEDQPDRSENRVRPKRTAAE